MDQLKPRTLQEINEDGDALFNEVMAEPKFDPRLSENEFLAFRKTIFDKYMSRYVTYFLDKQALVGVDKLVVDSELQGMEIPVQEIDLFKDVSFRREKNARPTTSLSFFGSSEFVAELVKQMNGKTDLPLITNAVSAVVG